MYASLYSVCVCISVSVCVCVPLSVCVCVSFSADHYLSPWELEGRRGALMATSRPAPVGWRERGDREQRREITHTLTTRGPSDLLRTSPLTEPPGSGPPRPLLGAPPEERIQSRI